MGKTCPHCKSSDLDVDPARADTVCTNCGSVLEESAIVSEVTIQDNADGSSSVVGQFVSSEGTYKPYLAGFHYGTGKESRQITLDKGKRSIRELAGMLSLNRQCIDTAFNFYKMAISKRLSRGRRIKHLAAACLYMTCRTQTTPHMLLDFSDVTQVNVFTLGKVFLTLAKELHIQLPILDPCIYITRFAHRLDFGDKTHEVSVAAMRLVSRMKRDWLHTGRRPSGLCGAALLVAARLHGYTCDLGDIVNVVKISHDTIRKRLVEFECTPSSKLTINEFMKIDLEAEHDPPAFINSRIKAKLQALETEAGGMNKIESEIDKISDAISMELGSTQTDSYPSSDKKLSNEPKAGVVMETEGDEEAGDACMKAAASFVHSENPLLLASKLMSPPRSSIKRNTATPPRLKGPTPTAASLGLNSTANDYFAKPPELECDVAEDDGRLDLEGIDDSEIEKLLLTPHEVAIKERIWMAENGEFVKEMEEKREQRRLEAEKKEKSRPRNRKAKHISKEEYYASSRTAGEAIEKLMQRQKLSSKINYEALKKATESDEKRQEASMLSPLKLEEIPTKRTKLKQEETIEDKDHAPKRRKTETPCLNPDVVESTSVQLETVIEESDPVAPSVDVEAEEYEDEGQRDFQGPEEEEHCLSTRQLLQRHAGMTGVETGGFEVDEYDYEYD